MLCANEANASEVECFVRNAFMHAIRQRVGELESSAERLLGSESMQSVEQQSERVEYTVQQSHFDLALLDLLGSRTADTDSAEVTVVQDATAIEAEVGDAKPSFEWSGAFSFGV